MQAIHHGAGAGSGVEADPGTDSQGTKIGASCGTSESKLERKRLLVWTFNWVWIHLTSAGLREMASRLLGMWASGVLGALGSDTLGWLADLSWPGPVGPNGGAEGQLGILLLAGRGACWEVEEQLASPMLAAQRSDWAPNMLLRPGHSVLMQNTAF